MGSASLGPPNRSMQSPGVRRSASGGSAALVFFWYLLLSSAGAIDFVRGARFLSGAPSFLSRRVLGQVNTGDVEAPFQCRPSDCVLYFCYAAAAELPCCLAEVAFGPEAVLGAATCGGLLSSCPTRVCCCCWDATATSSTSGTINQLTLFSRPTSTPPSTDDLASLAAAGCCECCVGRCLTAACADPATAAYAASWLAADVGACAGCASCGCRAATRLAIVLCARMEREHDSIHEYRAPAPSARTGRWRVDESDFSDACLHREGLALEAAYCCGGVGYGKRAAQALLSYSTGGERNYCCDAPHLCEDAVVAFRKHVLAPLAELATGSDENLSRAAAEALGSWARDGCAWAGTTCAGVIAGSSGSVSTFKVCCCIGGAGCVAAGSCAWYFHQSSRAGRPDATRCKAMSAEK